MWEWNEAVISSYRGYRGGSFSNYGIYLHASSRDDAYEAPTYEDGHVGFRVAEVP